jgi:hypothetical protein
MEGNRERELDAREQQGIKFHIRLPLIVVPACF